MELPMPDDSDLAKLAERIAMLERYSHAILFLSAANGFMNATMVLLWVFVMVR
jgi:hypothetical protein